MLRNQIHASFFYYSILAVLFLSSILLYGYYFNNRAPFEPVFGCMCVAFLSYFFINKNFCDQKFTKPNLYLSVVSRLVLIFSFPILSDDIYRFIWDGNLIHHGINPFSIKPNELIQTAPGWLDLSLYQNMNSREYYSVYPPVNQFAFYLSALVGKGHLLSSIIILRVFILVFDLANIYLIQKLLKHYQKNKKLVYLYALNPLVIIEFTGNLHFEAVMIFFSLLFIWLLVKNKWIWASVALAFAICSKLLPIIFIPLLIKELGFKKAFLSGLITGAICLLMFLPFIHSLTLLDHFRESLSLYYGKFEFNGSFYQIFKSIGWKIFEYNPIAYTSKLLIVLTVLGFMITYIKSKTMAEGVFWLIFVYTIFGAIVHPWYILLLVAFTPFLYWRFGIAWSFLICLSYFTYNSLPYQENMHLLILEYSLLALFIVYEIWKKRKSALIKQVRNFLVKI